jgi:6-pyruvoyltetrahydropterin/6-carboxytetrahydropterin synthase
MEITVTKQFTFDAAHRLSDYSGKCYQLHGHTYKLELTVSGKVKENGMVIDFKDIKEIYKNVIEPKFDHQTILYDKDQVNHSFADVMPKNWVSWVSYNPTAENMVVDIIDLINRAIIENKLDVKIKQAILWETPTSFATINLN